MMYWSVVSAQHSEGLEIEVTFQDGSGGRVDMAPYIKPGTVFEALADEEFFRSFRVEYGTLVWGDGSVDLAPEKLYELATGKEISYGTHAATQ